MRPPGLDAFNSEAPIPLVLAATTVGQNAMAGTASLGTSYENPQIYAAGAVLPNGARLREIYSDRVVIERSGLRVTLYVRASKPTHISGTAQDGSGLPAEQLVLGVGGKQSHGEEVKPPPLSRFATAIRSQPEFRNGELIGFQIDAGIRSQDFTALGLKPRDIVVAIDGLSVKQAEQIDDLLGALGSGSPVPVTVERDGHLEHLNLDPQSLDRPQGPPPAALANAPAS